mgnify:CR=1 FL=1
MAGSKTKIKIEATHQVHGQAPEPSGVDETQSTTGSLPQARVDTTDARLFKRIRSGGPTSQAGKEIAKQNSLKHGAYAQRPIETQEFFALSREVARDLRPEGVIQLAISDSLAGDIYRSRSLEAYEHRQIHAALNGPVNVTELAKRVGFPWGEDFHAVLAEPSTSPRLQRELLEGWQRLAAPPTSKREGDLECMPDSRVSKNYQLVCEKLSQPTLLPHMEEAFFEMLDDVMLEARQLKSYLGKRIHANGEEIFLVKYWLLRNQNAISQQVHALRDEKALEIMTSEHLARARALASSSMAKRLEALAALRKLSK